MLCSQEGRVYEIKEVRVRTRGDTEEGVGVGEVKGDRVM